MQTFIQRVLWGLIWAGVFALALYLNLDMLREGQPALYALVALCLVVASASLYYTVSNFRNGAYGEGCAAFCAGFLALGVCIFSEVSFWSASIDNVQEQIQRERSLTAGQDLVKERRRKILAQSAAGKLPGQIEAEIAVAKAADIPALRAQFKAARELQALEGQVFADSTQVVAATGVKRTFYRFAQLGSDQFGGSIQIWVAGIIVWMVLTMTVLHYTALYIGWAPGRRREARQRQEASPRPKTEGEASPAVSDLDKVIEGMERHGIREHTSYDPTSGLWTYVKAVETKPEEPRDPPPSGGRPDPLKERPDLQRKEPEPTREEVAQVQPESQTAAILDEEDGDSNVFDIPSNRHLSRKEQRRRARETNAKKKPLRPEGSVKDWLSDCSTQVPHDVAEPTTSLQCWESYEAWCRLHDYQPVKRNTLTRRMGAIFGKVIGERGPRTSKGAKWPRLQVIVPTAEPLRKRA